MQLMLDDARPPSRSVHSLGPTATSAVGLNCREIGERVSKEMQLMLMMLPLPPSIRPLKVPNCYGRCGCKGLKIGERVSNKMQLMLMMLALSPSRSVHSLGPTATSAVG